MKTAAQRTPTFKFGLVVFLGVILAIPLFSVYLLVYDRQAQSSLAKTGIVTGWGDQQELSGPFLIIPFTHTVQVESTENGHVVAHQERRDDSVVIAPTQVTLDTRLDPELRKVSIYEAVVYTAGVHAQGGFTLPDFSKLNIDPSWLHLDQARLAMGISDSKGLTGSEPIVKINDKPLPLQPGSGLSSYSGGGFSAPFVITPAGGQPIAFDVQFQLRGNGTITMAPSAQDTQWHVSSSWASPSFLGGFLPLSRKVTPQGFEANWRIGNLALSRPIVSVGEQDSNHENQVSVALIDSVNLYSEVSRAAKYGFMFIGFTFTALLLFDILLNVSVPGPAYLLVGIGLILFFALLLAFAEVIGFARAYLVATTAIVVLLFCYVASVLKSWRRAGIIGALLIMLYAVLFGLISLEAYSLLIGSLLIFLTLAVVMYMTRRVDWRRTGGTSADSPD